MAKGRKEKEREDKEIKGNVIEKEREDISSNLVRDQSSGFHTEDAKKTLQYAGLRFLQDLEGTIRPRPRSDRTCFENVA